MSKLIQMLLLLYLANLTWGQQHSNLGHQTSSNSEHNMAENDQENKLSQGSYELKYNYTEVIEKSLLFYEAQRSGLLPLNNRVAWRGNCCFGDQGLNGEVLSGGYFTSGSGISRKFTFPNAAANTVLAWGLWRHETGYQIAGELQHAREAVDWGAAYLVHAHPKPNVAYSFVGEALNEDSTINTHWSKPEEIDFPRVAYVINATNPATELSAEMSASLAASSMVLKNHTKYGSILSELYLLHARQLYDFAVNFPGTYNNAVPNFAKNFYQSWTSYEDELAWAALWLYLATDESRYLKEAEDYHKKIRARSPLFDFSWDDKLLGVKILLAIHTKKPEYEEDAKEICNRITKSVTPKGIFFTETREYGVTRYASNVAFVCFELGEYLKNEKDTGINPFLDFAINQVNYLLGDTGRSYMIGFGHNYPKKPFHAGSSCPAEPTPCNYTTIYSSNPNPNILIGALVGGPGKYDDYEDIRTDDKKNDVGLDYNAGFQSLVAALLELYINETLPLNAYRT